MESKDYSLLKSLFLFPEYSSSVRLIRRLKCFSVLDSAHGKMYKRGHVGASCPPLRNSLRGIEAD